MQHKLYALRKSKDINMTTKDMASLLNIHVNTYREKEQSKSAFNLDEMFLIADCFDMNMHDIFIPRSE